MARITEYSTLCPNCKVAGVMRQLGFDDELGMVCCDAPQPHTFERMPDEPAPPREEGSGFASQTQQEPATTRDEDKSRFGELMEQRKKAEIDAPQPVVSVTTEVSVPPATEPTKVTVYRNADTVHAVAPGATLALPDGEILLGVVIPETWAQAVIAEAEAQGMPAAEYFSRWLTSDEMRSTLVDALVHYWSTAPATV